MHIRTTTLSPLPPDPIRLRASFVLIKASVLLKHAVDVALPGEGAPCSRTSSPAIPLSSTTYSSPDRPERISRRSPGFSAAPATACVRRPALSYATTTQERGHRCRLQVRSMVAGRGRACPAQAVWLDRREQGACLGHGAVLERGVAHRPSVLVAVHTPVAVESLVRRRSITVPACWGVVSCGVTCKTGAEESARGPHGDGQVAARR